MHTIESRAACTVRYVFSCTCNRTGKEREAMTIWQVESRGGGGSGRFRYYVHRDIKYIAPCRFGVIGVIVVLW